MIQNFMIPERAGWKTKLRPIERQSTFEEADSPSSTQSILESTLSSPLETHSKGVAGHLSDGDGGEASFHNQPARTNICWVISPSWTRETMETMETVQSAEQKVTERMNEQDSITVTGVLTRNTSSFSNFLRLVDENISKIHNDFSEEPRDSSANDIGLSPVNICNMEFEQLVSQDQNLHELMSPANICIEESERQVFQDKSLCELLYPQKSCTRVHLSELPSFNQTTPAIEYSSCFWNDAWKPRNSTSYDSLPVLSNIPSSQLSNLSTRNIGRGNYCELARSSVIILLRENGENLCHLDDQATRDNDNIVRCLRNLKSQSSFSSILTDGLPDMFSDESKSASFLVSLPVFPEIQESDYLSEAETDLLATTNIFDLSNCTTFLQFSSTRPELRNMFLQNGTSLVCPSSLPDVPTFVITSDDHFLTLPYSQSELHVAYVKSSDITDVHSDFSLHEASDEIESTTVESREIFVESPSIEITRNCIELDQCPSTTNVFKKRLISLLRLVFCVKSHAREDEL